MNAVKDKIPELVAEELAAANAQYPPFHSLHEGYAVMLEEVEETAICQRKIEETMKGIWTYTKCDRDGETVSGWAKRVKQHAMHAACEAIQVAAMAQKMMDYIESGDDGKTIDAQPVRHGHWILHGEGKIVNGHWLFQDGMYCSLCKEYGTGEYCPNCGAKMDGDDE